MKRKNIIIIGAGNTASEIYTILQSLTKTKKFNIQAILDDNKKYYKKKFQGIPIHIGIENASKYKNSLLYLVLALIKIKTKEKIFDKMSVDLERFPNIIDSSTKIEDNVSLGHGNIIYPYSVICSGTKIKNFCIFTHHNILAHNVIVNSFSTFGSRTSILNNTRIGKEVFVGANVLIGENISVDDYSTIIMGSVVLTNIKKRQVVFGNPAKIIKNG